MFEFRRRQLGASVEELLARIVDTELEHVDLILDLFGFRPYLEPNDDPRLREKMERRYHDLRMTLLDGQDVRQVEPVDRG